MSTVQCIDGIVFLVCHFVKQCISSFMLSLVVFFHAKVCLFFLCEV